LAKKNNSAENEHSCSFLGVVVVVVMLSWGMNVIGGKNAHSRAMWSLWPNLWLGLAGEDGIFHPIDNDGELEGGGR
jgi:hypothetical protein